ncbi:MAG: hypothetical protein ACFB3T_13300 [Geminicoccaceae bacterium]
MTPVPGVGAQGPREVSGWSPFIQGGAVQQFESDLDDGGSFSVSRAFVEGGIAYLFDRRNSIGLALAYGYDGYDFSGDDGLPGLSPWGSVSEYRISLPTRFTLGQRTSVFFTPSARWTAESEADLGKGGNAGFVGGALFRLTDTLRIGPGLGFFSEIEDDASVFPILLIDWQITDAWRLSTDQGLGATRGPGLTLAYKPAPTWEVSIGGRYERFRFRLDDDGVAANGVGDEQAFISFASVAYTLGPVIRAAVVGGVDFGGELTLEDSEGREIASDGFDPAPFLGFSFRARF